MSERERPDKRTDKGRDIKARVRERATELREKLPPAPPQWEPETEHPDIDTVTCYVQAMLESYRTAPKESDLRKDIDLALQVHARLCKASSDTMAKPRHNLLVLEYVIENRISHSEIQRRLGISSGTFLRHRAKGIRELARIATHDLRLIPPGHGGRI